MIVKGSMIGLLYRAIWPIPNRPIPEELIPRGNDCKGLYDRAFVEGYLAHT